MGERAHDERGPKRSREAARLRGEGGQEDAGERGKQDGAHSALGRAKKAYLKDGEEGLLEIRKRVAEHTEKGQAGIEGENRQEIPGRRSQGESWAETEAREKSERIGVDLYQRNTANRGDIKCELYCIIITDL